jgi:hypothetical protein
MATDSANNMEGQSMNFIILCTPLVLLNLLSGGLIRGQESTTEDAPKEADPFEEVVYDYPLINIYRESSKYDSTWLKNELQSWLDQTQTKNERTNQLNSLENAGIQFETDSEFRQVVLEIIVEECIANWGDLGGYSYFDDIWKYYLVEDFNPKTKLLLQEGIEKLRGEKHWSGRHRDFLLMAGLAKVPGALELAQSLLPPPGKPIGFTYGFQYYALLVAARMGDPEAIEQVLLSAKAWRNRKLAAREMEQDLAYVLQPEIIQFLEGMLTDTEEVDPGSIAGFTWNVLAFRGLMRVCNLQWGIIWREPVRSPKMEEYFKIMIRNDQSKPNN